MATRFGLNNFLLKKYFYFLQQILLQLMKRESEGAFAYARGFDLNVPLGLELKLTVMSSFFYRHQYDARTNHDKTFFFLGNDAAGTWIRV